MRKGHYIGKIVNVCYFLIPMTLIIVTLKNLISNESWLGYDKTAQLVYFLICFLIGVPFSLFLYRFQQKLNWKFYVISWIFLIVIQIIMVFQLSSDTGWDSGKVINAALGNMPDESSEYLSIYPNNLFLVYLYRCVFRIFAVSLEKRFLCGAFLNVVFLNITIFLLYFLSEKLLGMQGRLLTLLYFVLLIGVSPWLVIPYSDLAAMPFTVGIVLFYLEISDMSDDSPKYKGVLASCILGLLLIAGIKIKPTVIISFIAVCIVHSCTENRKNKITGRILAGSMVFLILINCLWNVFLNHQDDFMIDEERSVSFSHYLMIGLNDNYGCYTEEDIALTLSAGPGKRR